MNNEDYKVRLKFIHEDVERLCSVLPEEVYNIEVPGYENVGVVLSNIEIASNLGDDECLNWVKENKSPLSKVLDEMLIQVYSGKDKDETIRVEPRMVREDFNRGKDLDKMPNQKWHQIMSFFKSTVRIIGYCFIPFNLVIATTLLVLSELIGIIEELV